MALPVMKVGSGQWAVGSFDLLTIHRPLPTAHCPLSTIFVGDATMKSTVEQIRERFDHDVERFSNLETGQSATVDAPLTLDLITSVAAATTPSATHLLDIGCGAGNYTLKILQRLPNLNVTLVDLSKPMLDRAVQRVRPVTMGEIKTAQADIRDLDLGVSQFDIIIAAAVFHH